MLNEIKFFFDKIGHFRQLLKEAVGNDTVVDAIQKHKIVYIYYTGKEGENEPGYRTIVPCVLGASKSKEAQENGGYMLLRAWEIAGNSFTKKKYSDVKGRQQYGWRLFRTDRITSFLPTGKFFSTDEKKFPDAKSYTPNDSQMTGIVAAVQITNSKPTTALKGDVLGQKITEPPSIFAGQKEKFQYFSKMGKKQKEATADEIEHLWGIAEKIKKKSKEKLLVVADEHGDLLLKDISQKDKLPPESIVGNLKDLYIKLVKPNEKVDNSFFDQQKKNLLKAQKNNPNKNFFKK